MKRSKYFLLAGVLFLARPAPVVAQMAVADIPTEIQTLLGYIEGAFNNINQVEQWKRFGQLGRIMSEVKSAVTTARKVMATARGLQQLKDGNLWAAPRMLQMWGVDSRLVGLSSNAVASYQAIKTSVDTGNISPWSVGTLSRAYRNANAYIQAEREKRALQRAADAAAVASQAAGDNDGENPWDMGGALDMSTPESQTAHATQTAANALQAVLANQAASSRLEVEKQGLAEAKAAREAAEAREAYAAGVHSVAGSIIQ